MAKRVSSRQKMATALVVAGKPVGRAMAEAGYSKNTANNPKVLTESRYFLETMDRLGISDEKLAKVLDDGLNATKTIVMGKESNESFVDIQPDHPTRHKFLETALRLKGHSKDEGPSTVINQILVKFIDANND